MRRQRGAVAGAAEALVGLLRSGRQEARVLERAARALADICTTLLTEPGGPWFPELWMVTLIAGEPLRVTVGIDE
jgi:hypothetical protein